MDTRVVPPSIQSHAEDGRTAAGKDALKRDVSRQPVLRAGQVPGARHAQRLLHGAGLHGARPPAAALDQHRCGLHAAGLAHRGLPVGRVPDRARTSATT
ncbi:MAG: hypothetical protein MZW92_01530 [Comamonadaceae bacterium]|nr:hypothetical protein [Comamonadaceae bacterium]